MSLITLVSLPFNLDDVSPRIKETISDADLCASFFPIATHQEYLVDISQEVLDLRQEYQQKEHRAQNYKSIAEKIVAVSMKGKNVVYVSYGYSLMLDNISNHILTLAKKENIDTMTIPAYSFVEYVSSQLQIPIGVDGVNVIEASYLLQNPTHLANWGLVMIAQIGIVNNRTTDPTTVDLEGIRKLKNIILSSTSVDTIFTLCDFDQKTNKGIYLQIAIEHLEIALEHSSPAATLLYHPSS